MPVLYERPSTHPLGDGGVNLPFDGDLDEIGGATFLGKSKGSRGLRNNT